MISITVNLDDKEASRALAEVISALTGTEAAGLNAVGGRAAQQAAAKYHREFDASGGWRGKRYLGEAAGDGSHFGSDVARGWKFEASDADGATISNDASYYAFKVSGGTITPKRAKALTIPLIPEAKGLRASVYQQNTGRKLFISKSRNALLERLDELTTGSRGRRGQAGATAIKTHPVRAVYALVKSVTQPAWPGAMPPEDVLAGAFSEAWREALADHLEDLE